MKKAFTTLSVLFLFSFCTQAQTDSKKDTTVILKTDIYSNPRKTGYPASPDITIPYEANVNEAKPTLIAFDYQSMTVKADSFFARKLYKQAIELYTEAFRKNNDLGLVKHRHNLACCYVNTNVYDSAFTQLFRIAEKGKYFNYAALEAEICFKPLHSNAKWKKLVELVKKNAQDLIDAADAKNGISNQ